MLLPALAWCGAAAAQVTRSAPAEGVLEARQLAIVINDDDPDSVAIGAYYRRRRAIPAANVVHVRIPGRPAALDPARFRLLKAEIDSHLAPGVEAVLMLWSAPWKVGCHGITGAYTLGFDAALCADPCAAGKPSRYFNAPGGRPVRDYGMRLSMLLPIASRQEATALIDRGVVSGMRRIPSHAWYLTTSEAARNARAGFFPKAGYRAAHALTIHRLQADVLEGAGDVLVYQTGKAQVDKLDTVRFVPGALADHLTSHGGELEGGTQMSSLRWLAAGATASYGTVGEPCNHWQKFPNPGVLLRHYLNGDSAIEAYWKSVAWPAQGVFIGEPLAAPFRGQFQKYPRTIVR
ncbi:MULTISPECIES: TIGR03790 family protein [unclassified Massilia]|uniref:TIGR03790 family protein n=1 Tax=unclassified Massilia TaxID=2609279 RepID=UPI0017843960|nr:MULTISPECIES: TIGR03790 family protein [unclassified Massilia]MBD8531252.1 TIGR03790 family protein [Massilia sp. CFBP 13647]MBD8676485.1 TIGR03790 family protein [Massilia sp. CFBP 13721]